MTIFRVLIKVEVQTQHKFKATHTFFVLALEFKSLIVCKYTYSFYLIKGDSSLNVKDKLALMYTLLGCAMLTKTRYY